MKKLLQFFILFFITGCEVMTPYEADQAFYESLKYEFPNQQKLADTSKKLENNKSKCREYGFKDNTDGMGNCLIELRKLDAIENQIAQQQAEIKKQQQAEALIRLGAIIGGAGSTNPQPKIKPSIPSYSESYTISRTLPSNQNCPLLGAPLKKQEVRNGNRICYY
tara:strand:+ start:702 stop:1196 length:495 start_codon:yes stop_codon:yes gene_type:complete